MTEREFSQMVSAVAKGKGFDLAVDGQAMLSGARLSITGTAGDVFAAAQYLSDINGATVDLFVVIDDGDNHVTRHLVTTLHGDTDHGDGRAEAA